jgi:hypothetical protein
MSKWLRHIFRRITGFSTPLGGISWNPSATTVSKVPTLRETIHVTWPENDKIISFLENNDHRIIFLDTDIDASVSFKEQFEIVEKNRIDLHRIASGAFNGMPLPLPNRKRDLVAVTFYFNDDHVLRCSAGGTGIITVRITGFFEVSRTFHGGPSTDFHLKEIKASLEAKVDILNR